MHPPAADRQIFGDTFGQPLRQAMEPMPLPQLLWGVGLTWGRIIGIVPSQETLIDRRDTSPRGKAMLGPALMRPEIVEGLDHPVVVGLVFGGEEGPAANIETQPHRGAQAMRLATTAEGAFVVELGQIRQTHFWPCFQQVFAGSRGSFVRLRCGWRPIGTVIGRGKGLPPPPA